MLPLSCGEQAHRDLPFYSPVGGPFPKSPRASRRFSLYVHQAGREANRHVPRTKSSQVSSYWLGRDHFCFAGSCLYDMRQLARYQNSQFLLPDATAGLAHLEKLESFRARQLSMTIISDLARCPRLHTLYFCTLPTPTPSAITLEPASSFLSLASLTVSFNHHEVVLIEVLLRGVRKSPLARLGLLFVEPDLHLSDLEDIIKAVSDLSLLRSLTMGRRGWLSWNDALITRPVDIRPLTRLHKLRNLTIHIPGAYHQLLNKNIASFGEAWPYLTRLSCMESYAERAKPNLTLDALSLFAIHMPNLTYLSTEIDATILPEPGAPLA